MKATQCILCDTALPDDSDKRYCVKRGTITLVSENPAYAPIVFIEGDEMQIWGVVKNSIRNL